jgi:hypothetical protein
MSRLTIFRNRHRHVRLPILVQKNLVCCDTACPWFPGQGNQCELFGELRFDDHGEYLRHNDCVDHEDSDDH